MKRAVVVRAAVVGGVVTTLLAVFAGASFAADGRQGEPALVPASVEAPTQAFSFQAPVDARCEEDGVGRTGADNWRWHGFIVEAGRDLSTLRFGPLGPGDDFDATDGTITAALLTAGGEGVWQRIPGLEPEGHINPDELTGFVLDPTVYTLRDGDYQIGFACTDGALATRQWWATTVTISTSAAPFMTTPSAAGASSAPAATDGAPPVAAGAGSTTTTAATLAAATADGAAAPGQGSGAAAAAGAVEPPAATSDASTGANSGVSSSPLAALSAAAGGLPVVWWALLAVVFARAAYLLARRVRTRPLSAP